MQQLEQIEETLRTLKSHFDGIDAQTIEDRSSLRDLQTQVAALSESVERAMQIVLPRVEILLSASEGTEVSLASSSSCSILQAAECGDSQTLLALLEAGANIRQRNQQGDTALHLAAAGGNERAVACLIGYAADVNLLGPQLRTPLHLAAERGHVGAARRLLAAGAKADVKDAHGFSPLVLAARGGHSQLVSSLLVHGASSSEHDKNGDNALISATKAGHLSVAELMVKNGLCLNDEDKKGNSAMVHAAKAGAWDIVKLLCQKGASATIYKGEENCPLLIAAEDGHSDAVSCLLSLADPPSEVEQKIALSRAKDSSVVWAFEDTMRGTLRGEIGEWAMREAAYDGRVHTMVALLDAGVDINTRNKQNGGTALYFASNKGRTDCVRILLDRGVMLDIQCNIGYTALHCASFSGHEQIVRLLLEAGADTALKNNDGKTAMEVAKNDAIREIFKNVSNI